VIEDKHNVVPVTLAVLLHVIVFASLIVAFDFGRRNTIAVPLAIKGTLVTDNAVVIPPKVVEPPPKPDTSEQERLAAEAQKRIDDARIEKERLEQIRQQEAEQERQAAEAQRKREAEAEAEQKRQAAEAQRKREAEAEADKERRRLEAEQKREQEVERQRLENERLRREAESSARQTELDVETDRLAAVDAGELAAYRFALQQKVERNWVKPASSPADLECEVRVQQLPGGEVVTVSILTCNGDAAVRRSIEAAINKASPLPTPRNPNLFDRNLRFTFRPEQ